MAGLIEYLTHVKSFGENVTIFKQWILIFWNT
jgi:hypothetical protein